MRMTDVIFKKLFQKYQESELSVNDFCANQDIATFTFYYWKKKQTKQNEPANGFVPLVVESSQFRNNRFKELAPVLQDEKASDNGLLEFVYPNGTKVLLKGNVDISLLKAISFGPKELSILWKP